MNHSTNWKVSDIGSPCWISDPEAAYVRATVTNVDAGILEAVEVADDGGGRFFRIDLPAYTSKEQCREKLLKAIRECVDIDLA